MIETSTKSVQNFLSNNNQQLEQSEQILHVAINYKPNPQILGSWLSIIVLIPLFFCLGIKTPLQIQLFLNLFGICIVFIAVVQYYKEFKFPKANPKHSSTFGLITTNGIRIKEKFIPWELVHEINRVFFKGRPFLIFNLSPQYYDFLSQNIYNSTYTSKFVFLGHLNNSDRLFKEFTPFWKPKSPGQQLKNLAQQLKDSYQLRDVPTLEHTLEGNYKKLGIQCSFNYSFPVEEMKIRVLLPKKIRAFLKIARETDGTRITQAIGGKDIQIGHPTIDKTCLFESSHPIQLQQFFTLEVKSILEQLLELGRVNFDLGEPIKQKRLKNKQRVKEDEGVLDTGMLLTEIDTVRAGEIEKIPYVIQAAFTGTVLEPLRDNPEDVVTFIELCLEFTVLLAEHIVQIGE